MDRYISAPHAGANSSGVKRKSSSFWLTCDQVAAMLNEYDQMQARVRELEGAIHSAYVEGYCDAHDVVKQGTRKYAEEYWKHSESCKQLKGTP